MNEIQELQGEWAVYRYRIKKFEHEKESELRKKYPDMAQDEIDDKILVAVDRKFQKESRRLIGMQMALKP